METDFRLDDFDRHLEQLVTKFGRVLQRLQSGRAHPGLLDGVKVAVAEGEQLPLNQLSTVLVADAATLKITPFAAQHLAPIVEAIASNRNLGFNPTDDGRVVYVPVPPLTTERRRQLVKTLQTRKEDFLVRLRHRRHRCLKQLEELVASRDERQRLSKQIEQRSASAKRRLEDAAADKVQEIMDVNS